MDYNFSVTSGSLIVSDPSYQINSTHNIKIENAKNGTWLARIVLDKHYIEDYVSEIVCYHSDHQWGNWEKLEKEIHVDSGQVVVFDFSHFRNDDDAQDFVYKCPDSPLIDSEEPGSKWYNMCCDVTLSSSGCAFPFGAVCTSGFGDGAYEVFVSKTGDEVTGIRIVFISHQDSYFCCPICGKFVDEENYCSRCDAFFDDVHCSECGGLLDYDGVCPNHCKRDKDDRENDD